MIFNRKLIGLLFYLLPQNGVSQNNCTDGSNRMNYYIRSVTSTAAVINDEPGNSYFAGQNGVDFARIFSKEAIV